MMEVGHLKIEEAAPMSSKSVEFSSHFLFAFPPTSFSHPTSPGPPPYVLTVLPSHDSTCMQLFAVGLKGPGGGDVRVISLDGVEVVGKVRVGKF